MNLKKLLRVLEKQERNLKNLINIGTEKKDALMINNHEDLNKVIVKEEQMLLTIQLTEEDRLLIMRDLFNEFNIDNKRYKISILLEKLKNRVEPRTLKIILEYETRIKGLIEEITKINQVNMLLIKQSSSLINEITREIILANKKSAILDRKV